MPRTVRQVYAAAVCFVSVGCLAIALGIVGYCAIAVVNPSLTLNPMSVPMFDAPQIAFSPTPTDGSRGAGTMGITTLPQSGQGVTKRREAPMETAIRNELIIAKQSLLRWSIAAAISGVLFFVHWRMLRTNSGRAA
jgi:hypothetical protein